MCWKARLQLISYSMISSKHLKIPLAEAGHENGFSGIRKDSKEIHKGGHLEGCWDRLTMKDGSLLRELSENSVQLPLEYPFQI